MGGLMTFHLAGGEGGAAHTLDLAGEAFERWWANLGELHLTPEVRAKIIAGTAELAGTRSIADWIRWRDEQLVGLVRADGGEDLSEIVVKIRIIGGGPAGLFFAYLMKRDDPRHDVAVYERDPEHATYGRGLVFSDFALSFVRNIAPEVYAGDPR